MKRLSPAFALAGLVGCGSLTTTKFNEVTCTAAEETNGRFIGIPYQSFTAEGQSKSCMEGYGAAQVAYIGRNAQGQLYPKSAVIALEFDKEIQNQIKSSEDNRDEKTNHYYRDVKNYFDFYLKKIGGLTIDDIREYVDQLIAERQKPAPAPTPPPTPKCAATTGTIMRSCSFTPATPEAK